MSGRLKDLRFDKNNVPILRPDEIEERAEYMLWLFAKESRSKPKATNLNIIINTLMAKHKVKFVFTEDLGYTPAGAKIRGRIALQERTIWVDRSLQPDQNLFRLRFTLGHELGHLALHRHREIKNYHTIDDTDEELRMQFNHAGGSKQIVEWQANRYASAVLMPRYTVVHAILVFHQENDIHLNCGMVYVDNTQTNRRLYAKTLEHLSVVFHVSRTVARIRLQELNLLIDRRERRTEGLADELARVLNP